MRPAPPPRVVNEGHVKKGGLNPPLTDYRLPLPEALRRWSSAPPQRAGFAPPHPGDVLRDIMARHAISQGQLARAIGISRGSVNRLVNAGWGISAEMALRLSRALASSPEFWLNLQREHDLWHAHLAVDGGRPILKLISDPDEATSDDG